MNETLQRRLAELESSAAHPEAVRGLRRTLTEGSDLDCYKINAFRFADEQKVARVDALRALLYATRLGLLDLNWDIHCPACKGIPEYHRHLMKLNQRSHCGLCAYDFDVDLEDVVEVTFTANPAVRTVRYQDFAERDFEGQMQFFDEILGREQRTFSLGKTLTAGESWAEELRLHPGAFELYLPPLRHLGAELVVEGAPAEQLQDLQATFDGQGRATIVPARIRPGPLKIHARSSYPGFTALLVREKAPERNWVSATYLTQQQDFRDLFSGEFLAPDVSFAIRSVTLMFTDLRGSTELYERLGDARAYALVQSHFRILTEVIRRHEGGVVKTIGDAVMASFPDSGRAVAAACEIQRELGKEDALREIQVKIGLHRGPTIAVTSNRMLDYFGRTVNIAARVQNESRAGEVLLSEPVVEDGSVQEYLARHRLPAEARTASLKGISGAARLLSLQPAA